MQVGRAVFNTDLTAFTAYNTTCNVQVGRAVFNTDLTAFTVYNTTCNVQVGSLYSKSSQYLVPIREGLPPPKDTGLKPPDYFEIVPL